MITKHLTTLLLVFSIISIVFFGCKKDDENNEPPTGTANFNVSLENSAAKKSSTYESVDIDIQKVSINVSSDTSETSGWFDLETNQGIYDLLDYAAGFDTLVAYDSLLNVQTISQIRLLLGNNNTIVDGGETFDLDTPSAQTSGLKINVHAELQPNMSYKVVLDFDSDKSIVKTGNNKYKLKPVINATLVQQ